jgi:ATP-dependent helicase HrpB
VLVSDPALGIDRLELQRISLASARQRAGRAGRTAPGRCVRLWSRAEELGMDDHAVPEVLRADMAATVLALKDYGAADPAAFGWFEAPPAERLDAAVRLLQVLGAIDKTGGLTTRGRAIARMPVHPRLGALLLAGAESGLAGEAAAIAAVLSEKDLFRAEGRPSERRPRWTGRSDVLDRAEALDSRGDAAVDIGALMAARRTRDALRRLVEDIPATRTPREDDRLKLLLHAYPDRVSVRREGDPTRGVMVGRRGVVLDGASTVREGRLFLSIDPRETVTPLGTECRVSIASSIEPEWLEEIHPQHLESVVACRFDPERERVLAERERRFLGLTYKVEGISPKQCEAEAAACFAGVIRERLGELLAANEALAGAVARIRFLGRVMPDAGLPPPTDDWLAEQLANGAGGCLSWEDFRERDLASGVLNQLDWSQRSKLDAETPSHLTVPTGNRIRLDYTAGDQPVLAVRLQELFGLAESPRVAGGRVPVLLHLLGPNHRPVQVTSDLRNFWNTTYAEVRKELRARYPKHAWPEDPWNEPPTARGGHRRRPPP